MDIKINSYEPGIGSVDTALFTITVDGTGYLVAYERDQPIASDFSYAVDEAPVQFEGSDKYEILERLALFLTFFDERDLAEHLRDLTEQAVAAMEQHLAQNAAGELKLHHAVKITAEGWRGIHGLVSGVGFANGMYEVAYWAGNSGAPHVHAFHYRDLRAL